MPDFTLFIPFDIFSDIVSHLNQADCIEYMTVCRRWHNLIPSCGKHIWKNFEISETSWTRFNNAILECLETNVEKVSFLWPRNIDKLLRQLGRRQCSIQSLEIQADLRGYKFDLDHVVVFKGIGLFGRTLKELFINGPCTQYFSLTILLRLLPALTHLTIKFSYLYTYKPNSSHYFNGANQHTFLPNNDDTEDDHNNNYNLVFLSLDSDLRGDFHVKKIVSRCPRLRYLLVSDRHTYEYPSKSPIGFKNILELCPSIRYNHWGEDNVPIETENDWRVSSSRTKSEDSSNKNNNNNGESAGSHLRQVEFCNNNDVRQYTSALTTILQETSLLEHLHLYTPYFIFLHETWNIFKEENSNLLLQPPQLKSLELVNVHVPLQRQNIITFQDLFCYFRHIERLKIVFLVKRVYDIDEQENCMFKIVTFIRRELHQLRYLYLGVNGYDDPDDVRILHYNLFWNPCDWKQNLEILHLDGMSIGKSTLLDLCSLPTLHTLKLSGYVLNIQLREDVWVSFARKLIEQEQSSCNGGTIRSILLSGSLSVYVTDKVLEEFAGIKSLEKLHIEYNNSITDAGVNKFERIRSGASKKRKKIELYCCRRVSLENPHAVFVSSPFIKYIC